MLNKEKLSIGISTKIEHFFFKISSRFAQLLTLDNGPLISVAYAFCERQAVKIHFIKLKMIISSVFVHYLF